MIAGLSSWFNFATAMGCWSISRGPARSAEAATYAALRSANSETEGGMQSPADTIPRDQPDEEKKMASFEPFWECRRDQARSAGACFSPDHARRQSRPPTPNAIQGQGFFSGRFFRCAPP